MIGILGSRRTLCDGLSRRDFLQVGALGGLSLAALEASAAPRGALPHFGKAKVVILLFLYGGASQRAAPLRQGQGRHHSWARARRGSPP